MKRLIDVHTGEIMASSKETILKSDTNNACLVFVAYDPVKKIGGLAHAVFMSNGHKKKWCPSVMKDADKAIDDMIEDMTMLGSKREDIVVRLISGENIKHEQGDKNYIDNISLALDLVKKKNIKCDEGANCDVGSSHVVLDVSTGELNYT